jgi:hypothetical protein
MDQMKRDPFVEMDKAVGGHRDSPLNPQHVTEVFEACRKGVEVNADGTLADTAVSVEGVRHTAVFNRAELDKHRKEIGGMLAQLPLPFLPRAKGGSGGWSILQACTDRDGNQWTGLHLVTEQLFLLGLATGQASFCMPDRELWAVYPFGMPYIEVDPDDQKEVPGAPDQA